MSSRRANDDRLSLLPDELLAQILSLIPTKSAVGTSVLSKRWRYSWTLVHSLDFHYTGDSDISDCDSFLSFVDRVLKLCKTSQLKLFRLQLSEYLVDNSHVPKWINEAVRLNVCELDVRELPLSLFTCKTLTKLRLAMGGDGLDVMNVPDGVILPCLKTFDIKLFQEPFVNVYRLISGCPILESLSLSIKEPRWGEYNEEYKINIPTLKRFELKTPVRRTSDMSTVVLNVPNLEYLIGSGFLSSLFVMEDLPPVVEASVSFSEVGSPLLTIELLKALSVAKSLSWSTSTLGVPLDFPLPKFSNLKLLEFKKFSCFGWFLMFEFLQRSCELEDLCIEEPDSFCWKQPVSVPICMLSHLRTLKFISFKKRECDIKFVEYVLANAKVLKTLTIISEIWPPADEMPLREQLLKFPRASGCCEIHFVRRWSHFTSN